MSPFPGQRSLASWGTSQGVDELAPLDDASEPGEGEALGSPPGPPPMGPAIGMASPVEQLWVRPGGGAGYFATFSWYSASKRPWSGVTTRWTFPVCLLKIHSPVTSGPNSNLPGTSGGHFCRNGGHVSSGFGCSPCSAWSLAWAAPPTAWASKLGEWGSPLGCPGLGWASLGIPTHPLPGCPCFIFCLGILKSSEGGAWRGMGL